MQKTEVKISQFMSKIPFKDKIKDFWGLMINVVNGFLDDKCMKMSASLAYYTVFSIGPLIMIVIWCIGFFYGTQLEGPTGARDEVFREFTALFGKDVAVQIQSAIQKISFDNKSNIGIIVGIVTLIITSTTIFVDIQDSINTIWKVKAKVKKGWVKLIINRLISFSMVLGLGFLLIASLMINGIIVTLTNTVGQYFDMISLPMLDWINTGITFLVITSLFGFIFSFLPDAKVRFRDILGGAIFTALLFMIGRYGISTYLSQSATASAYGAAGSIIVLLGWVYYSSAILYFGAEFTKEIAIRYGKGIQPTSFAVLVKQTELEIDSDTNDAGTSTKISAKSKK